MEMIDVLKELAGISNKSPEIAKAIDSVTKINPTEVAPPGREKQVKALKGKVDNPYAVAWSSYNKSKGKKEAIGEDFAKEGGMSDVHIGAQEAIGEYTDEDGNLNRPKADVLSDMAQRKAKLPFPQSFEIETAMKMVNDDFDDDGSRKEQYEPEPDDVPHDVDTQMNMDAPAEEQFDAKMHDTLNINGMTTDEDVISMIQDTIDTGKGDDAKDYLEQFKQYLFAKAGGQPDQAETKELNTEAMKKEDKKPVNESKKPVKEAITMSADTPQEASMLMQIMKLAGVQQVTPDMIGAEEPSAEVPAEIPADNDADAEVDHDAEGHACPVCGDDAVGSNEMGRMRDMVSQNDGGDQAEETWDNEPNEKVDDIDTLVNVHSGGLNRQKQQVRKEYPGDNPLAVKEDPTEEELSNSLRNQYESFKKTYQEATKVAETHKGKDHDKDGDVDSKDYMKSKDIAIKKAMKK